MRSIILFAFVVTMQILAIIGLAFDIEMLYLLIAAAIMIMILAGSEIRYMHQQVFWQEYQQERTSKILCLESRTIIHGKMEDSAYLVISEEDIESDDLKAKFGEKPMIKVTLEREDEMEKKPFTQMILILQEKGGLHQFYKLSPTPIYLCGAGVMTQGSRIFVDLKFIEWHGEFPVFRVYQGIDKNLEEI